MVEWQRIRDWEVCEAISDLSGNSYDLVGRDFPLGMVEADILQYKSDNFEVEAGFFYSGNRSKKKQRAESAAAVLRDHDVNYRIFLESAENARPSYKPSLNGNYFFDSQASQDVVRDDLEELMPADTGFSELTKIGCEK